MDNNCKGNNHVNESVGLSSFVDKRRNGDQKGSNQKQIKSEAQNKGARRTI